MSKRINPITEPCDYELEVPGSKSIALRQLLMSALSHELTTLVAVPPCEDVDAMLDSLTVLGTEVDGSVETELRIRPDFNVESDVALNLQQSGVSLRLLLAAAGLRTGRTSFAGQPSLAARPNSELLDSLSAGGCSVSSDEGKLPITVQGKVKGPLTIDASRSSQYASALMLIAPMLATNQELRVGQNATSRSYLSLTLNEMQKRGVDFRHQKEESQPYDAYLFGQQSYKGGLVNIEGDASAATYHMALATLHGGRVKLRNIWEDNQQGDLQFTRVCEALGAKVVLGKECTEVVGPAVLSDVPNGTFDMKDMPDAALTLMGMAPFFPRPTLIKGLHTLPLKECDRIECPATELRRAGIRVETTEDSIKIWPGIPQPTEFQTYDDHRMAMSMAVLATKTEGCRIQDPKCVNKTYTQFWEHLSLAYD